MGLDVILDHASAVGVPESEGVLGGCVSLLCGLAHQDFWIFISGLAQGVSGRPELVTMTCSLLRSRTAVTVVVQDWPSFDCTVMRVPTSSGGRVEVSPR